MDKKTLLIFMKRILDSGSQVKSNVALKQLRNILSEQGADRELVKIVDDAIDSMPEVKDMAKLKASLTESDLKIAAGRAEDRRRRAAESANRGRCW